MKRFVYSLSFAILYLLSTKATAEMASGRVADSFHFEIYGGLGEINSLSGKLIETQNSALVSGGLNTDFGQLGIDDGTDSLLIGGSISGKWITFLVDYRQNTIDASGIADSEIRLSADQVNFGGQSFEYLLIPVGSEYTLESDTNLLGLGLRFTPLTINPGGRVRFTPWIHAGLQYVDTTFDLDSANNTSIETGGFQSRTYVVNGRASGEAQLIIPEIGFGGEVRFLFHDEESTGPEVTLYGTYKILDLQGDLDTIGVEDDEFDRLDVSYSSLEIGANFYYPLGDSVDLLVGIYFEDVETNTVLESKPSAGNFEREVELDYTLFGLRAGLRF